jgi:hypothetical protein
MSNKTIAVEYLPPTNTKGSRLKAFDNNGNSITIGYPFEYSGIQAARVAAEKLMNKMNWKGTLVEGSLEEVYVFIIIE